MRGVVIVEAYLSPATADDGRAKSIDDVVIDESTQGKDKEGRVRGYANGQRIIPFLPSSNTFRREMTLTTRWTRVEGRKQMTKNEMKKENPK